MHPATHALIAELDAEAPITRRVLERLPAEHFDWQPHPKSLTAGQLAHHIATIPGNMTRLAQLEGLDMATRKMNYAPSEGPAALLAAFDASVAAAREMLSNLDEARGNGIWRMTFGNRELFAVPRVGMLRTMCFNHWYHHRGELVVYLRLLDVSVPAVYGRSADENPFAQMVGAKA
jgi:uncharacterized damage-inducible protein DinB